LTYNLGTAAIRAAAANGLTLERCFTSEQGLPHHYRYALTPDTSPWTEWVEDRLLGTLRRPGGDVQQRQSRCLVGRRPPG